MDTKSKKNLDEQFKQHLQRTMKKHNEVIRIVSKINQTLQRLDVDVEFKFCVDRNGADVYWLKPSQWQEQIQTLQADVDQEEVVEGPKSVKDIALIFS